MEESDENFVKCLSLPPTSRSIQDIFCIQAYFKTIEALKSFKELTIKEFSRIARYERYERHSILYKQGEVCTSWYIVLSGCVLVGQTMYFPRSSFGHRSQGNLRRYDECVILEKTELIVFDYSLDRYTQSTIKMRKHSINSDSTKTLTLSNNHFNNGMVSKRSSHSSDTSSAYSDYKGGNSCGNASFASDNEDDDADLDSLSQDIYSMSDTFYDVIVKEPSQRSDSDIDTILEGVQNLPAFLNFPAKTKYELCKVMKLAMVHNPDEKLLDDGQVLDTWNVVLNGVVEVRCKDGSVREYTRGDSFGVRATSDEQKQNGEMRTISATCCFCCVLQKEFCDIISRNMDSIIPEKEDNGKIVLVYEERQLSSDSTKTGRVVVKGTAEKLINTLMLNQHKTDPMYIENFLLTYRVFVKSPKIIAEKFCQCYEAEPRDVDTKKKATIRKSLILWANSHFVDLDDPNSDMAEYLEKFENIFSDGYYSNRDKSLFLLACSSNSKPRVVTIEIDKSFMKNPPFRLIGLQKGWGLFIKEVNRLTIKKIYGLRRGDQILSLANYSWERIETLDKATDLLNKNTSCSIELVVKYNPSDFHEILDYLSDCESGIECEPSTAGSLSLMFDSLCKAHRYDIFNQSSKSKRSSSVTLHGISDHVKNGLGCVITPMAIPRPYEFISKSPPSKLQKNPRSANTSPTRQPVARLKSKPKFSPYVDKDRQSNSSKQHNQSSLNSRSNSNPDLRAQEENKADSSSKDGVSNVNQVLKVFRPNQSDSKYILITISTSAKDVVPLIMKAFAIDFSESNNYALYMVTVESGPNSPLVKSSRVALYSKDLAGKLALNQRYYLKNNQTDNQLITEEQAKVLLNESKVTLSQLSPLEIATRLTLFDYSFFRNIQAAEYINYIFKLPPLDENEKPSDPNNICSDIAKSNLEGFSNGYENYQKFENLINQESFWPTNEICSEPDVKKRADLIKKFIKVAKICEDLKNFNSLMCIITGLTLTPVSRLKSSWEKVPSKSIRAYEKLSFLTDMSFNFRQIRKLVSPEISEPPLIPCLALHSKDLAAIHLGNKTSTKDGLINFEKLRMMASEIRKLMRMCNTTYNLQSILSSVNNRSSPSFLPQPSSNFNHSMDESDGTSGISECSKNSDIHIKSLRSNSVDQFALNGTLKKKNFKRKSLNVSETSTKKPEKIYEEWLSTLKVRTYLSNLHVEMNISRLQELSQALEPPLSLAMSSPNISNSASTVSTDNLSNDSSSNIYKTPSPKSSVTINLNQTKPPSATNHTAAPISPVPLSPNSSQSLGSSSQKIRSRPQSIFSYQNAEDIEKMMELITVTKKVPRKLQNSNQEIDSGVKYRSPNPGTDQNYLRNLPMYNSNILIQELIQKNEIRKSRLNTSLIPGGLTLNLQDNTHPQLDKTDLSKGYCYPPASVPFNDVYYTGDRKKCMKPDLPSYETARAISQYQKLSQVPYPPNNSKPILQHLASMPPTNEINYSKPPVCQMKQPKLPSYNQHLSRANIPLPEIVQQPLPKRNGPPPPPRTVTMEKPAVISNASIFSNNINNRDAN